MRLMATVVLAGALSAALVSAQEAPIGSPEKITGKEQKALDAIKGQISGKIVWSSSRANSKHDIWIMNADGTEPAQLTKSLNNVDWFARISPDGAQVLFVRTKGGWVPEGDAEMSDKWDVWSIKTDGTDEKKLAENACWGNWADNGAAITFARKSKVFKKDLASGEETEIFDAETVLKKGAYSQQPSVSGNGKFLAVTIRGSDRQTGLYNFETKQWSTTGGGCQIIFTPDNKSVIRMNEGQGNGGTEVLKIAIDDNGVPQAKLSGMSIPKEIRLIDLPGRMSHEYFPKTDQTGTYMVWCASKGAHEHDVSDYEMFIWKIGSDKNDATRLTFHSGNDRWPDLHIAQ